MYRFKQKRNIGFPLLEISSPRELSAPNVVFINALREDNTNICHVQMSLSVDKPHARSWTSDSITDFTLNSKSPVMLSDKICQMLPRIPGITEMLEAQKFTT